MKKIKVGIIGFGLSGSTFHAPIISLVSGFDLVAIASSNSEKVTARYPQLKVYAQPLELIADPTIDLVVVTAPNQYHFSLTKLALEHNKHVVVEKPFVTCVAEGEALIKLAQERNLVLSVYHNRRWDNDFIALKQCLTENSLGEIYQCEIRFERFRPQIAVEKWREQNLPGSGLLYDLGSHLIDQALHLFGWPKSIYADMAAQRTTAVVNDYFHLLLGYEKLKVILHVGSIVKKPGPRFLVHGTKGSFIKYGLDPQEKMLLQMDSMQDKNTLRHCEELFLRRSNPEKIKDIKTLDCHAAKNAARNDDIKFCTGQKQMIKERGVTYENMVASTDFDNSIEIVYEENGIDKVGKIQLPMGDYRQYYQQLYDAIVERQPVPVSAKEGLDCVRLIEYAMQSHLQNRTLWLS